MVPANHPLGLNICRTKSANDILYSMEICYLSKNNVNCSPYRYLLPKKPRKLAYEFVSDTFDRLVEEALDRNDTFVYEGHFTNDATWLTPKRFKDAGYEVHLIFLGVKTPEISHLRVTDRVNDGGHYVDRLTIESNFYGNLEKLNQHLDLIVWNLHLTVIINQTAYKSILFLSYTITVTMWLD